MIVIKWKELWPNLGKCLSNEEICTDNISFYLSQFLIFYGAASLEGGLMYLDYMQVCLVLNYPSVFCPSSQWLPYSSNPFHFPFLHTCPTNNNDIVSSCDIIQVHHHPNLQISISTPNQFRLTSPAPFGNTVVTTTNSNTLTNSHIRPSQAHREHHHNNVQ